MFNYCSIKLVGIVWSFFIQLDKIIVESYKKNYANLDVFPQAVAVKSGCPTELFKCGSGCVLHCVTADLYVQFKVNLDQASSVRWDDN